MVEARAVRYGYGTAELAGMHPAAFRREALSLIGGWCGRRSPAARHSSPAAFGLLLLAAYPARCLKILVRRRAEGTAVADAALYASSCVVASWPAVLGSRKAYGS